jgi:aryl-alcohol dehydrogenase-like predicted oxidoreductase
LATLAFKVKVVQLHIYILFSLLLFNLQVSILSYGFWATFGAKSDLQDQDGIKIAKECLRIARDAGINLFDNAEAYGTPFGEAERIMGIAIKELQEEDPVKWRRSDIIITTKVFNKFMQYSVTNHYL